MDSVRRKERVYSSLMFFNDGEYKDYRANKEIERRTRQKLWREALEAVKNTSKDDGGITDGD